MLATMQRMTTTGPRSGGSRFFASPPCVWPRAPRSHDTRPAHRHVSRKLASGFFRSSPAPHARRVAAQAADERPACTIFSYQTASGYTVAPNNAANPAAVTTVQLLGRQVDGAPSGDLHGALLISGDGQALVVSAQPSAKISGWTQIKNLAGVDVGITISPQTPSAPGSSGEFAKYQSSTTHDASPVFIVNQSFNQTVTQINTFNDAVRSQGVPYLTRTQNSNSYAFTLLQVITQQPYSGSSSYYGAGTWIPTPAAPKPPAAPQPAQPSHNP
jgi:hypothetical protein